MQVNKGSVVCVNVHLMRRRGVMIVTQLSNDTKVDTINKAKSPDLLGF